MSRDTIEFLMFEGIVAAMSLVVGVFLRRWWLSSLLATAMGAIFVPLYAVAENGWRARLSDVAFWLPMMAMWVGMYAAPVAMAVGFLLHLVRKGRAWV
jgi:type II secretory pathway component PulF